MKTEFNKRYQQLEEKRERLFDELKSYSDEILNKKPAPTAWSITEVISHLMAGEQATLTYLQKKTLDNSTAKKAGLKGALKYFLLKIAFDLPLKFKAATITSPKSEFHSLNELDTKWTSIRKETYDIVNKLTDNDLKKELWPHPVAGKMNLFQMVDFFTIHFERHKQQIDRTIKIVMN